MSNIPSMKKEMIISFMTLPKVDGLTNNKLILSTSCGIMQGEPLNDADFENNLLANLVTEFAKNYFEKYSINPDESTPNNDGYIALKNVTFQGNPGYNMPFLVVFYDQILGVSIGNLEASNR